MRRFAILFPFFRDVREQSSIQVYKLIALLLSFPCFKASHFFFKLAYALQQHRLLLTSGEDFFLKFYSHRVARGGIVQVFQSLRNIEHGLERAKTSKNFANHAASPWHKER